MIDFSLSDEQKALQQRAREFARKEIAPVALQYDREPVFPGEILRKAHADRVDETHLPQSYGGARARFGGSAALVITEELNVACSGIAGLIGISSIGCAPGFVGGHRRAEEPIPDPALNEAGETCVLRLDRTREQGADAGGIKTLAVRNGRSLRAQRAEVLYHQWQFCLLLFAFRHRRSLQGVQGHLRLRRSQTIAGAFCSARWKTRWVSVP